MSDAEILNVINQKTAACEKLVDDVVHGRLPLDKFSSNLKDIGVSLEEARDYVQQLEQRIRQQGERGHHDSEGSSTQPSQSGTTIPAASSSTQPSQSRNDSSHPSRASTPDGLTAEQVISFRKSRQELLENQTASSRDPKHISDDISWAILRAKLNQLHSSTGLRESPLPIAEIIKLFGDSPSSPSTIPTSVLSAAPHLSTLSDRVFIDPHLQSTWKLRQTFASDKAVEPIIDLMQLQPLVDPIPRTLWRQIIQDVYVDFEKLHASMDRGYSHQDEPKEFAGGFSLVKKDHYSARKPIRNEADWSRVFHAWKEGVCLLYPHRSQELQGYHEMVIDLFRAAPSDPSVAINFDVEARDRYSRSPYHMDDRSRLNVPLLTQMFRKRNTTDHTNLLSKRAAVPCQNWSLGLCEDPCAYRRKHGTCSECGGGHRARDREACLATLEARRRKGFSSSHPESRSSSNRA